jgi:chemotaxis protein methyltransferase CheR
MHFADNPEKWAGWSIQIHATDVSSVALMQARRARYSQFEIQRGLPVMLMLKYFEQEGTDWQLKDPVRKTVIFASHNLLEPAPQLGVFDLILCRNALMYLCDANRGTVFGHLADRLRPDGMLMLGAAETVIGQTERFKASREFRGFYERTQTIKS